MHWVDMVRFPSLLEDLADRDRRIAPLYEALSSEESPADLLLDDIDEIVGDGYHRCQMYMDYRTGRSALHGAAFQCGPRCGPRYVAEAVRAGANYWKHRGEWPTDEQELRGDQRRTLQVFHDVGVIQPDYRMSNLLHAMTPNSFTLSALVELLVQWREAFDEATARAGRHPAHPARADGLGRSTDR